MVADTVPVMVWSAGADTLRTFFNQVWLALTGRTLQQELGNGWIEAIHPEDRESAQKRYRAAFQNHEAFQLEYRLCRVDGEYRWVLDIGVPREEPKGTFAGFTGTCIDITERKRSEDAQRFLAEAGEILASSLDYEVTFQNVARLTITKFADWCSIDILAPDGTLRLVTVAHIDPSKVALARELRQRYPLDPDAPGGIHTMQRDPKSVLISTIPDDMLAASIHDPDYFRIVRALNLTSLMIVPILAHGQLMGILNLVSAESGRHYNASDLMLAEELSRRAGTAIENARLYREAQQARQQAEQSTERMMRLHSVTNSLLKTQTASQVARVIIEEGLTTVGAVAGSLGLLTDNETIIELIDTAGYSTDVVRGWTRFAISMDVPLADAIRTGQPIWLGSSEVTRVQYPSLPINDPSHQAWAAIPLITEGRIIGGLGLSFSQPQPFNVADRAFILLMAQKCARAIDQVHLYETERAARLQAEQANERMTFLAKISVLLTGALDYNTRLESLAALTIPYLADWSIVDVVENDGKTIRRVASAAKSPDKAVLLDHFRRQYPLSWDESHSPITVLRSGQPELFTDATGETLQAIARDAEHLRLMRELGYVSSIVLPLTARGRTLGALQLVTAESGRHYTPDDVKFAEELAGRAALALDNGRLYDEMSQQRESLRVTLASIGDAVIATDPEGYITFMNAVAETLTGWQPREATGIALPEVFKIISESTREAVENPVTKVMREGTVVGLANHTLLIRKDGVEVPIDDSGAPIRDENSNIIGVILVFRDITERRRTEASLEATLKRTKDLYETCREIGVVYTPADILRALLASHYVSNIIQAAILIFDQTWTDKRPETYEVAAAFKDIPLPGFAPERRLDSSPLVNLLSRTEPVFIEDIQTDQRLDTDGAVLAQMGISSMMIFPLIAGGECFGLLPMYCATPHCWSPEDFRHIQIFIDQVSVAMDNVRLFAAEQRARNAAEQANELKLKFLAMISHELRTPLASIKGFASTLLATDVVWDPESQREFIEIINDESDKLTDLIEKLLDLSRLQAGTLRIQLAPRQLEQIIDIARAQLESLAIRHKLVFNIPPDLPMVIADAQRIAQVLANLVGNAVKYSPEDTGITILATAQSSVVQIDVSDEGPGISPQDKAQVFEAFRQADNLSANQLKGAGLGLAICKGLIEAHHGKIWIADRDGPGTTVSFTLPMVPLLHS